jgi:uroporphyrin-III C-methyltransferase / precorrin-2 dehydrogenase / sirohydrochlorin ferrochelatase
MFPAMLSLRGRRCLVVGGGGVALRKVETLLAEGAAITVVATDPHPRLVDIADHGALELARRPYQSGEASRYALAFAATDDRTINERVCADASTAGVWVNVADDPTLCSFHVPARITRGNLQITVSSAGDAPFAVRRIRQLLARRLGHEWSEWLDAASRFRATVRAAGLPPAEQEARFDRFFDATVDGERLHARVPLARELETWSADSVAETPAVSTEPVERHSLRDCAHRIMVCLVGGGPGDAGLLTVRGRQRLMAADAVVYDRLAASALPCDLPDRVELHCVGKEAGHHPVPQEEINALLIRLAKAGMRVVRLKGGDPFVFGRGGEEAEALRAAGIGFEVVPGVTAGVAVPAFAGIPVTHRHEAVRLTFLTAHESTNTDGTHVRWDLLARDPHATLVGYMGVTSLADVARRLIAAGMDPATPAAIVERGTTAAQRTVRSSLDELPRRATEAAIAPPALFIIGPTVRHATALDWFTERPLNGERLVVPAPGADMLSLAGAEVVDTPLPSTAAARVVVAAAPITGIVVRTGAEVELLDGERGAAGWCDDRPAWCLSGASFMRASALGWRDIRRVADPSALVAAIAGGARGRQAS